MLTPFRAMLAPRLRAFQCLCCCQPIIVTDGVIRPHKLLEFCLQWRFYQRRWSAGIDDVSGLRCSMRLQSVYQNLLTLTPSWAGKMLCASVTCQVEDLHWWLWNAHKPHGKTSSFQELLFTDSCMCFLGTVKGRGEDTKYVLLLKTVLCNSGKGGGFSVLLAVIASQVFGTDNLLLNFQVL